MFNTSYGNMERKFYIYPGGRIPQILTPPYPTPVSPTDLQDNIFVRGSGPFDDTAPIFSVDFGQNSLR
jgi:hypothetical protein